MKTEDLLISVICPLTAHEVDLDAFVKDLISHLNKSYTQFEILFVDDRESPEKSTVVDRLVPLTAGMRLLRLSKPHGIEVALTAGLDSVIGDVVVILVPGLDPVELVPRFIELVLKTDGVVMGVRQRIQGETIISRLSRRIFYWMSQGVFQIQVPRQGTYFLAFNRKAVTYISRTKDRRRFIRFLTAEIGLPVFSFPYEMKSNQPFRGFWASVSLSLDVIASSTTAPLRAAAILSGLAGSAGFVAALVALSTTDWNRVVAYALAVCGFAVLAVGCEYLRLLVTESNQKPLYYVQNEMHSAHGGLSSPELKNIVDKS